MRLAEALRIVHENNTEVATRTVALACGFTPMHLATFLVAHSRKRTGEAVRLETGAYGDLRRNLASAAASGAEAAAVVIEWPDLDPRLGLRSSASWSTDTVVDISAQLPQRLALLRRSIEELAAAMPVIVSPPVLPLLPIGYGRALEAAAAALTWRAQLAGVLADLSAMPRVRVLDVDELARRHPEHDRGNVKLELFADFPYATAFAEVLSGCFAESLFPPCRRKGLITDLDDTLWHGIVGDVGVDNISWSVGDHAQVHGIYQQFLASLAETGVLIGVASKNSPEVVQEALSLPDIRLKPSAIFPIEAGWGAKSAAVGRILKAWNVAADAVVFVDDNLMELAEVEQAHPGITCLRFRGDDPASVLAMVRQCRDLFGKTEISEEDRIRLNSLRAAAEAGLLLNGAENNSEFIAELDAEVTVVFDAPSSDHRARELVNKTNQFNLNGRRFSETEWEEYFRQSGASLVTVSYTDRFGPLGKIAVVLARQIDQRVTVDSWVMSCRAFSRQIEHRVLDALFTRTGADAVQLRFARTARNEPLQRFLRDMIDETDGDKLLPASVFRAKCPALASRLVEMSNG